MEGIRKSESPQGMLNYWVFDEEQEFYTVSKYFPQNYVLIMKKYNFIIKILMPNLYLYSVPRAHASVAFLPKVYTWSVIIKKYQAHPD